MRVCVCVSTHTTESAQWIMERQTTTAGKHDHPELKYDAGRSSAALQAAQYGHPTDFRKANNLVCAIGITQMLETTYLSDKWNAVNKGTE